MKVNWKEIAASPVYQELKKTLIDPIDREHTRKQKGLHSLQSKEKLYRNFHKIIGRAKHYAYHKNVSLVEALTHMKKTNHNYLSAENTSCILNRLDSRGPLCWMQKLKHNRKYTNTWPLTSRKKYPKQRWSKSCKERRARLALKTSP
jgi:hypothetical protein